MRKTLTTTALLLGLLITGACTTVEPEPKTTTTAPAADKATTDQGTGQEPAGEREFTESSFAIVWDTYTETDRDTMCGAVALLSPDGAQELYAAVPDQGLIDWALWMDLMQTECEARP
ncbi:hypothetical protein [Streptomyces sp. IB2014 016-6]|uniref:hypothetical protein n=1 Tax=Streptomyces sp. IB2014 016-6 TaxID=2517818 RepID=UPI0011CC6EC1|nr:hypothetical protein [Streptomyces sp. IB2014 016-6]TXL91606.1 hypothetical protein EW053_04575 [Streptomyces sp. IB2014 016-6]